MFRLQPRVSTTKEVKMTRSDSTGQSESPDEFGGQQPADAPDQFGGQQPADAPDQFGGQEPG